jgi:hypothetical protein
LNPRFFRLHLPSAKMLHLLRYAPPKPAPLFFLLFAAEFYFMLNLFCAIIFFFFRDICFFCETSSSSLGTICSFSSPWSRKSSAPFCIRYFYIGSHFFVLFCFARSGLKPQLSSSLPPEWLGLQSFRYLVAFQICKPLTAWAVSWVLLKRTWRF